MTRTPSGGGSPKALKHAHRTPTSNAHQPAAPRTAVSRVLHEFEGRAHARREQLGRACHLRHPFRDMLVITNVVLDAPSELGQEPGGG
jgi:hypothetical protein